MKLLYVVDSISSVHYTEKLVVSILHNSQYFSEIKLFINSKYKNVFTDLPCRIISIENEKELLYKILKEQKTPFTIVKNPVCLHNTCDTQDFLICDSVLSVNNMIVFKDVVTQLVNPQYFIERRINNIFEILFNDIQRILQEEYRVQKIHYSIPDTNLLQDKYKFWDRNRVKKESMNTEDVVQKYIQCINEMNTHHDDGMKFQSLQGLQLPTVHNKDLNLHFSDKKEMCIVYCLWGNKSYFKFLYFSILSQLLYTDIRQFDIRLFVTEYWYKYVVDLFRVLIPEEKIIKVPDGMTFKYGITTHSELREFEVISFCDTDAFVFTKDKQCYKKLYQYHKKNRDKVLMCSTNERGIDTMTSRFENLGQYRDITFREYLKIFYSFGNKNKIQDFLYNKKWFLSCHFSYYNSIFNSNTFRNLSLECLYNGFACDETVWVMYLISNNIEIDSISKDKCYTWVNDTDYVQYSKEGDFNEDLFIHPITGELCSNPGISKIYDKITKDVTEL